jgi:6-phosphogluconolactonase (cycloisomerase 2 family)
MRYLLFSTFILILIAALFLSGCAAMSDVIGLNYDTKQAYMDAVDEHVDKRQLDPVIAEDVKRRLYALWTQDRQSVVDSYELDDAISTVVISKMKDL